MQILTVTRFIYIYVYVCVCVFLVSLLGKKWREYRAIKHKNILNILLKIWVESKKSRCKKGTKQQRERETNRGGSVSDTYSSSSAGGSPLSTLIGNVLIAHTAFPLWTAISICYLKKNLARASRMLSHKHRPRSFRSSSTPRPQTPSVVNVVI